MPYRDQPTESKQNSLDAKKVHAHANPSTFPLQWQTVIQFEAPRHKVNLVQPKQAAHVKLLQWACLLARRTCTKLCKYDTETSKPTNDIQKEHKNKNIIYLCLSYPQLTRPLFASLLLSATLAAFFSAISMDHNCLLILLLFLPIK